MLAPTSATNSPRKTAFENAVASRRLLPGIAIDDGVAVHIVDGIVADIVRARGLGGNAYCVEPASGAAIVRPLECGTEVNFVQADGRH